jgi:hypothetical protein
MQTETLNGTQHVPSNRMQANIPDAGPENAPSPKGTNGRGPDGRFAPGNPGGPGNPFAREVAALRRAALAHGTPERITDVMQTLYEKACGGNMTAARLYLSYTAGKSTQPPDPDRLTLDEWDIYRKMPVLKEDFKAAFNGFLVESVCELMRFCLPYLLMQQGKQLAAAMSATPAAEPAKRSQKTDAPAPAASKDKPPEPAAAPAALAPEVSPPSPDGGNGAPVPPPEGQAGDDVESAIGDLPLDPVLASLLSRRDRLLQRIVPSTPSPFGDNGAPARPRRKKKKRKGSAAARRTVNKRRNGATRTD